MKYTRNLVCSIGYLSTTEILQMITLGLPLTCFTERSNLTPYAFIVFIHYFYAKVVKYMYVGRKIINQRVWFIL